MEGASADVDCRFYRTNCMWKSPPQTCDYVSWGICLEQKPSGCPSRSLLTSAARIDTHGYELPEIPCCHLVFPTADHQPNELRILQLSFWSEGLQQHHWRLGQPAETRHLPAYVTAVWISQLSQAGARRALWLIFVKHTQPFQTFTGESIYCLHLTAYLPCFVLGDHGQRTGSRRTPKHHFHLSGLSQAQALLLAPGRVWSVQGRLWSKKLGQMRRSYKQPHGVVMEPSTSRQQAGSVARFPGQASQPEELVEQCPTDLSSGTNFHVKKRTWLWVSLVRF